ncbi:MAG: DUF1801 domain-containing protein [Flavobacteriaceae bacterium]|nr:DUF1801 domain-containing protein [Flavobacteriaceae bacterium]
MQLLSHPEVSAVFERYPEKAKKKLAQLRTLILSVAEEMHNISSLEETLAWGEPSYKTTIGSTLRIDWKPKKPHQCGMYFQCTSKLIPTFRILFPKELNFEGSRAILLPLDAPLPKEVLKPCIQTALQYHKVKHLLMLGL